MKKLLQQLVGESAIYGISSMLNRFVSIFLVPLYTQLLAPEEYGKLSLVNSTYYFVTTLAVFAMDSASARWYYDSNSEEHRKPVMATWFWFQLGTSAALAVLLLLLSPWLSSNLLENPNQYLLFIVPALGLLTAILPNMVTNWLRYQRKAKHTMVFTICNVLLTVGLNMLLVLGLRWGILGILVATVASNLLASVYVFFLMKDWIALRLFSRTLLYDMLKYAYPLVPTAFAFWILNSSSTFVINHYHNKTEVGLFQMGNMLASAVSMVVGAFQMAWGPFAFSILDKPEAKRVYAWVLIGYTAIMCTAALALSLFAREILILFTQPEYYAASSVASILGFNSIIYGFAFIGIIGCNVQKDNKPLAWSVFAAALVTGILYWILVPMIGKEGAALSTCIGYCIVPIWVFIKSQQYYPIPFSFGITGLFIVFALGIAYIGSGWCENSWNTSFFIQKIGLLLAYIVVVATVVFYQIKQQRITERI
jgi:O-antigen/teichoic acid export membrane protein